MDQAKQAFDIVVVGGGPVGLSSAIAIAQTGARVALVAKRVAYPDSRTTALLGGSVAFLASLDVWQTCEAHAAPLRAMRLVDVTDRLIRAPEVCFDAGELGLSEFGWNLPNKLLVEALENRAQAVALTRFDADATAVMPSDDTVTIRLSTGDEIAAALCVAADGRRSVSRAAAGIATRERAFDQMALTFNVAHRRPHGDVSTEFHTAQGPCVIVPLPGDRSSVVWVADAADARRLHALDDPALGRALERLSHSILGAMTPDGDRHLFPLAVETSGHLAANRVVLVGEAAHVLPPIGAQGLNLGLRDASAVADAVGEAAARGDDLGGEDLLARYERRRRLDIGTRTRVVEMAHRSLLSDFLPVQAARAGGLALLSQIAPLRRLAMREGLSAGWFGR